MSEIIVLRGRNCRRSRRIVEYLTSHDIPFRLMELDALEARPLIEQHDIRSSPGIIVDGRSVNPFDLLEPGCRVNETQVRRLLLGK